MSAPDLERIDAPGELPGHFEALGVDSIVGYKLWCYRNGFGKELDKSPAERQAELDFVKAQEEARDPDIVPHHDPKRAAYMARIFGGEFQNDTLSDMLFRVRAMYNNLSEDPEAQQVLKRLVLHAEKYSALMRPIQATNSYGHMVTNTFLAALEQLARHRRDWIRQVEDWRPEGPKPLLQFQSLARHLLAKYDVPPFFDLAFFQGTTPQAQQEQSWFKHVGMGQNLRTAGVPMRLTKRMAHLVMQERYRNTVTQAMRKTQYETFGGNTRNQRMCAWTIAHGPLGEKLENEEFWETVVQFIANQSFLDRGYINPIIDYIRNQKFTPQRIPQPDGTEVEGPPPHPNFRMKGRSINRLIREVDVWHEELTGLEDVALETWDPSGFRKFEHTGVDPELRRNIQWTVAELTTSQQLCAEGRSMHHCAGSYVKRCATGERSVWSLRAIDLDAAEENQVQEHVLSIEVNNKARAVVQTAGKYNLQPFGKKHLAKERKTGNVYLHLLRQAPTIMRMWMDREGLSHASG